MGRFNVVLLYVCNKQNTYNPDPKDTEDGTEKNHDYVNQDSRPVGGELRLALEDSLTFRTVAISNKNKMGRACSTYGGGERCVQGFGGET
jgi:hypothetical protein